MKAGQFTDEQIVAVVREAAQGERPVTALCKDKGISEATFPPQVRKSPVFSVP